VQTREQSTPNADMVDLGVSTADHQCPLMPMSGRLTRYHRTRNLRLEPL
jgi:hypothetical protein